MMTKRKIIRIVFILFLVIIVAFLSFLTNARVRSKQLIKAVGNNDFQAAQVAIENGAWVNMPRHWLVLIDDIVGSNETPLIIACKNGNEEIIELLIESGADVNKQDNVVGSSPLSAVFQYAAPNRFNLAMYLIDNGADIHASSVPLYESIILYAEDSEQTIEDGFALFQYLMQQQVDWGASKYGKNILTHAASNGNNNVIEYLITNQYFDVDSYDDNGHTALIEAAMNDEQVTVEILLSFGADIGLADADGKTAYDYAVENENREIAELLAP